MNLVLALFLILIAGIINGSYAAPMKYTRKWKFENLWLQFSIWAFVIVPWVAIFISAPSVLQIYASTPGNLLFFMIVGGLFFGLGQICFAMALHMIGLGLGFVINVGLGMGLGFFLPLVVQHPDKIFTPFGVITLTGTLLAILGLIISTYSGHLRDLEKKTQMTEVTENKGKYFLGVLLAVFAGFTSAGQNFAYSMTLPMQQLASQMGATPLGAANIMWPGFLLCAFIPYALNMLYLHGKNKTYRVYRESGTAHYYLFTIIMGLFWYGSLIFYSKAAQLIGDLGPLVGWPMFMVLIILTSNFWGWRHGEWTGVSTKVKTASGIGLSLLVLAVIVLAYSSLFHT